MGDALGLGAAELRGGLAYFEFTVLDVAVVDADLGLAGADDGEEFLGRGAAVFGFFDGGVEAALDEAGGRELAQEQFGVAFLQVEAALLEGFAGGAFLGEGEEGAYLHAFGAEGLDGETGLSAGDAAGGDEGQRCGAAHGGDEAERGGFFLAVVTAGFKAFGYDGIDTGVFTLAGEERGGYDVGHLDAALMEP